MYLHGLLTSALNVRDRPRIPVASSMGKEPLLLIGRREGVELQYVLEPVSTANPILLLGIELQFLSSPIRVIVSVLSDTSRIQQ